MTDGVHFQERIRSLARKILDGKRRPSGHWEITALLETSGIYDPEARDVYGCRDTFHLAQEILRIIPSEDINLLPDSEILATETHILMRFLKHYSSGMLFYLPIAVQIFAILLFGYALWAWEDFTPEECTSVAIGTIASFIVTGGFAQVIGRRGLFYINVKEGILAKKICFKFMMYGVYAVLALEGIFLVLNLIFQIFPLYMTICIITYYTLLSLLWLTFSVLYMLKAWALTTLITMFGIACVCLVNVFLDLGIVFAHGVGISVGIILSFLAGYLKLRKMALKAEEEVRATELPRLSFLVYSTFPYFVYGFLYFLFLSTDRLIAWSAHKEFIPYIIWFRVQYELGMDWALLAIIITMGGINYAIEEFSEVIVYQQIRFKASLFKRFNGRFMTFYIRHLIFFLSLAIISVGLVYFGVTLLQKIPRLHRIESFFNPITYFVFAWAATGYIFLLWSLLNSILLFALSRPQYVIRSIIPSLGANFFIGFVLSRIFGYKFAVIGLTAGSIVFVIFSSIYAINVIRNLDYYYYSAF